MAFTETLANIEVGPCQVEWASSGLGYTDGDISIALEEQAVDVVAHQEGTNVLTAIRIGKSAEITLTFKETDTNQFLRLFTNAGGATDTSGTSGTNVIGWGGSKDFTQVTTQAGKLVLHPAVNSASDYSEDLAFWLAYPMVDSITKSGENPNMVSCTFRVFPDLTKPDGIRLFIRGDHTQTFS